MDISILNSFSGIPLWEVFLRVLLAGFLAFLMGYERQSKGKPMGCRSYTIVSVTTCLLAIMALELFAQYGNGNTDEFLNLDLGKIIAGTITGIGFLGAGAILKVDDHKVIGTTTGSSIWAAGIFGLVIGFGYYILAVIGYITLLAIIWGISKLEINPGDN
ncbi:MAG: hypothetical protein CL565_05290 [Alphaproteobacteria bacterium]|nr:hypothetical protein [Alphaproteobacteria bacterium]